MRWWDGESWTSLVTDGGSPFEERVTRPDLARLHETGGDLRARWPPWVIGLGVVVLTGGNVVVGRVSAVAEGANALALLGLTATLLYGMLFASAVAVHRRVQEGSSFRAAFGLWWSWTDLAWGLVLSLVARIAGVIVLVPIALLAPRLVRYSNVPRGSDVNADLGLLVGITIVAVIAAPVVEELFFRGLVQRALESSTSLWFAIAIASALFGLAHINPDAGVGNTGVVLATSVGGGVFGVGARVFRRLSPSIVGHMLFNAVPISLLWVTV